MLKEFWQVGYDYDYLLWTWESELLWSVIRILEAALQAYGAPVNTGGAAC